MLTLSIEIDFLSDNNNMSSYVITKLTHSLNFFLLTLLKIKKYEYFFEEMKVVTELKVILCKIS